ncbi:MAG: NYN domain-containing protein, partial [Candidatus Competibacteraceae bacterium]|nr:NYN domain-containing protein [Candidatus Competibacteraceae bacterium]
MSLLIQSHAKIGVYVDAANISRNGGQRMQYDILREFACRDYAEPLRLNVYLSYDEEKADSNTIYREKARAYQSALREMGYKVIEKRVKWYIDEAGNRYGKANADLDMAVDLLLQSENLDRVLLVTGDGDFVQVVRALQNKGCRVETLAFDNVSEELRRESDMFISGYLVPDLLPPRLDETGDNWGQIGSRV